jgi:hypothetical protein
MVVHQKPNFLSQKEKENNLMWVEEEEDHHQLYDFGFAQIPIHIMSRVSMWDSLFSRQKTKKRKKAQLSIELLPSTAGFLWNV